MNIPADEVPMNYSIDVMTETWVQWLRLCPGMVVLPFRFQQAPDHRWFVLQYTPLYKGEGNFMIRGKLADGTAFEELFDGTYTHFLVKRSSLHPTSPDYRSAA